MCRHVYAYACAYIIDSAREHCTPNQSKEPTSLDGRGQGLHDLSVTVVFDFELCDGLLTLLHIALKRHDERFPGSVCVCICVCVHLCVS